MSDHDARVPLAARPAATVMLVRDTPDEVSRSS